MQYHSEFFTSVSLKNSNHYLQIYFFNKSLFTFFKGDNIDDMGNIVVKKLH